MTHVIRFTVPGDPVPWARAGQRGKRHFTPGPQARHMRVIRDAWMAAGSSRIDGPVVLSVRFRLERPDGHWGTGRNAGQLRPSAPVHPAVRPDLSNYLKLLEDALNDALFSDDGAVTCFAGVHKLYAPTRGEARTDIEAWPARP